MMRLRGRGQRRWAGGPFVARLTTDPARPVADREREVLLLSSELDGLPAGYRAYLAAPGIAAPAASAASANAPLLDLPPELDYLKDGDVVRLFPESGAVAVLYRLISCHNSILLTNRCNCRCIMCPEPPGSGEDASWFQMWHEVIRLMSAETPALSVTGGEPTVVPRHLLDVIHACGDHLPRTPLHVLSNGRMFNYLSLCREVAAAGHPDLSFGIALYSDLPHIHDFLVQASGAFDQTVRGMMNLERFGVSVEIRIVLMRPNVERLPSWARFVARNLPFVSHVALMGMEPTGHARANIEHLWIDPADYQRELRQAVELLADSHMAVSVYNEQLCVLDPSLWPFARKSISDWKVTSVEACKGCSVREDCGGLFESAAARHSRAIRPL